MYTIKQASIRAGVSVPLLRQWERRYGIVRPARTGSGYRLYSDADIARVHAMRALVDDGWSPSTAAAAIRQPADVATAAGHPTASPDGAGVVDAELVQAFISAATTLDATGIDAALDDMLVRGSFEQTAERYLFPAMRAIGAAWAEGRADADGRADIAVEHAASHAILHRLGAAYLAAGRPARDRRPILVGLPPGGRHELGALSFSIAARRSGLPILYLGADLPVQDWTQAVGRTHAAAAVIGVVAATDMRPARRVADALEEAYPDVRVAFGGPAAANLPPDDRRIRLPDGLAAAVDSLRAALTFSQH